MYINRLQISDVRSVANFNFELKQDELAGWHVILGDNGSGKSSIIRSLAIILAGGTKVSATRQVWDNWLARNKNSATIEAIIRPDEAKDQFSKRGRQPKSFTVRAEFERNTDSSERSSATIKYTGSTSTADRTIWSTATGWFSASFGPFRRFTGGDREWDRLFASADYRRIAPHLSAFGEDVAFTEALFWLQQLHVSSLEQTDSSASRIIPAIREFVNNSGLLPHGSKIASITSQAVTLQDANGNVLAVDQMSDGYRSMLSLTFELLRQMFLAYGTDVALGGLSTEPGIVRLPGVVAIDEVDAHLHPAWQARIGDWFVDHFPDVQFVVTTHSPIVCRAARRGSIWKLPTPGSADGANRVTGRDYERLVSGDILEAFGTDFFGKDVDISAESSGAQDRIASLAKKQALGSISENEAKELDRLRIARPTVASVLEK